MKKALITGVTGQDGSYLAELLLEKGYNVHGIVRRDALEDPEHRFWRIKHLIDKVTLHAASLESFPSIFRVVNLVKPDECYHLAAASFVQYLFDDEISIFNTNLNGIYYILSAIKDCVPECRFYFAASSEIFGNTKDVPQNEQTSHYPRSAYGISKMVGYHLTRNYREAYNLRACSGILYNHESPRRGFVFVTRKITSHVAKIKLGLANELRLGNIDAMRDWGHAREYVQAMWLMLQTNTPEDYVIATGESHSVREFLELAFSYVGLNYEDYVVFDQRFLRTPDSTVLIGDATKAKKELGWNHSVPFENIVYEMVDADMELQKKGIG